MIEREYHVHLHLDGLGALLALGERILHKLERIEQMSQTLSQQLDAATAAIQADVAAVSAEVSALLASVGPAGSTITQAQVDALTAIDASLKAIPPAPTP